MIGQDAMLQTFSISHSSHDISNHYFHWHGVEYPFCTLPTKIMDKPFRLHYIADGVLVMSPVAINFYFLCKAKDMPHPGKWGEIIASENHHSYMGTMWLATSPTSLTHGHLISLLKMFHLQAWHSMIVF